MIIESQLTRSNYMKICGLLVLRTWYFYVFLLFAAFIFWMGREETFYLVLAFIYLIFLIFVISLSILRAGLSSQNRNFFLPIKYVFTDEIVTITSPISTETIKWQAFIKWKRVSKYYLLYVSKNSFLCIAQPSIQKQDVPVFESLLANNIKE